MRIYYAHHMWKYGTVIEEYEIRLIKDRFPVAEIVNPNGLLDETKPSPLIMLDYYNLILSCEALVFSTLSGVVGMGVYNELQFASGLGIPIYEISDGDICSVKSFSAQLLAGDIITNQNARTFCKIKTTKESVRT